jgi:PAS domain S-box-containing protein
MIKAKSIVSDWQPDIGRTPTPEQLRGIFQKELLDSSPALFLTDRNGILRWCNPGYHRIAEMQSEKGRIGDLLPIAEAAEASALSRNTVYREDRFLVGSTMRVIKTRLSPIFDAEGELSGFGGISHLISEQLRGIEADDANSMLDRYMDFVRLTADWIWEIDAGHRFTMASQRVVQTLAMAPQQFIGRSLFEFVATESLGAAIRRKLERLKPFRDLPFDAVDAQGKRHLFMLSAVPVFAPDSGVHRGFRGVATDITELTRREESLRAAKEQADMANLAKTQFLANISHELRTPLNAIIGFADVMRMEMAGPIGNPQYQSYLRDIHGSAMHLLGVINDILEVSRIETGKVTLHESICRIEEVVETVVRLVRERVSEGSLNLDVNVPAELPRVHADKQKLKQVVMNLIGNAIKFTPKNGKISIDAEVSATGELLVRVTDTGIGIEPGDIERVLEPFVQADGALHRRFDGAGLGLPLSRGLMRLHGGDVRLESEPGRFTRAIMILPASRLIDGKHLAKVK